MVRQTLKNLDVKKIKMAQQVLAVMEIMGIEEATIDELLSLIDEFKKLKAEVEELREFKEQQIRIQRMETKGGTSIQEQIREAFKGGTEEYNLNGRR